MGQSELTFVEQSVANLNVRLFRKESCCESLYDAGLWLIRMFGDSAVQPKLLLWFHIVLLDTFKYGTKPM